MDELEKVKVLSHIEAVLKAVTDKTDLPIVGETEETEEKIKLKMRKSLGSLMGTDVLNTTPDFVEIVMPEE